MKKTKFSGIFVLENALLEQSNFIFIITRSQNSVPLREFLRCNCELTHAKIESPKKTKKSLFFLEMAVDSGGK